MKNFWKKTAAGLLALLIVAGASPVVPVTKTAQKAAITASAAAEWSKFADGVTTLGTSGISAPKAPEQDTDAWTGSYVYYGQYENQPVKYRVLDPNTSVFGGTTMLLDCDTTLFADAFRDDGQANNAYIWTESDLYKVLNTNDDAFLKTSFTNAEAASIAESTIDTHHLVEGDKAGNVASSTRKMFVYYTPLTGEKIFLLDAEDASNTAYGYSVTEGKAENRKKKKFTDSNSHDYGWWLRSIYNYIVSYARGAGCIDGGGGSLIGSYVSNVNLGVSPAFNVDLESVIFSSVINPESTETYGKEYKLTLKDSNTTITPGALTRSGNTVTVPYTVTDSNENDGITADTVSVLILDSNDELKYYAPLTGNFSAENGSGTFELPADYADTDKVYLLAEDANEQYLTDYAGDMVEVAVPENAPVFSSASLTLGDDLGLNFYMSSAITDENAADYTVKFEGDCLEDEATLTKNESSGKYYATAHVYAKNLDKKITAKLYKGEEVICTTEYSVADYLEKAPETVTDEKALALIKATKAFGAMSADYFYEGEHGFSAAYNEYLTQSGLTDADIVNNAKNNYATEFTTDDAKISLVLDEKTAIRLYVKGVQPDGENLKPSKQANKDVYPSYYEIAGLTPDKLADEQTVTIGGVDHKFSALSWANRILDQEDPSEKNLNMAKAVTAYYLAAHDYYVDKHTVDLSQLTDDYYAKDGDILTGTTDRQIYVSGVTVTLKDAEIQSHYILCSGNSTIILEGTNKAPIQIQRGTLIIDGEGSLVANGSSGYAGIGGRSLSGNSANLIINGGNITATGGSQAAGIGGNISGDFGDITINGGNVTATGGDSCPGIGTGSAGGTYHKCGDITINGGTVTAIGTDDAPGIGSVYGEECGDITIADTVEKVTVTKGEDATYCIGTEGYSQTKCGTITIGGNVYYEDGAYVNGGDTYLTQDEIVYPAPIDLSALTEDYEAKDGDTLTGTLGENVKISVADGAKVTLKDVTINGVHDENYQWAGITCNGDAKLILEGENNVKGFYEDYPGIFVPVDKTLTIDGTGSLYASSNGYGAGIGGGYEINCGNIIIEGGTVSAEGGDRAAGIGGGTGGSCGNIVINGGTVTANGGVMGAGIGSPDGGTCGDITINGGTVTAKGGALGAGIGCAYYSECGNITIADTVTKVTATKGDDAPDSIGASSQGYCRTVTIADGANVEQN